MQTLDEDRLSRWGLLSLLAFSPLVYGGYSVWAAFLVAGGFGALLITKLVRDLWKGSLSWVWAPEDFVLLAGLVWFFIGLKFPAGVPQAFDSFFILLGCAFCFLLARQGARSGRAVSFLIVLQAIAAVFVTVGLMQLLGVLPHDWWRPRQFMASTFVNHNHFAAYLELIFPAGCLVCFAAPLKPVERFILAVSSFLVGIGIVLSCSRGSWLSLLIASGFGLAWFAARGKKIRWNRRSAGMALVSLAVFGFLVSQPPVFSRLLSLLNAQADPSVQMRPAMWRGTWDLIRENPWTGQGVGSFVFDFPRHRPAGLYRLINYAHNDYLQLVAEQGLVGLLIIVAIASLLFRRIVRLVRLSQTPWKQAFGIGGLMGLISLALHSLIDFPWHIPAVAFQASALAGLLTGMVYSGDISELKIFQPSPAVRGILVSLVIAVALAVSWPIGTLAAADVWAQRAGFEARNGRLQGAVKLYERATHLAPYRMHYFEQWGENLTQLAQTKEGSEREDDLERAAQAYRRALELVPRNARSAHALGEILQTQGHFKEADLWLEKAISEDPQNPLYWKHWAELKLKRGQAPEAADAFRNAAQLAEPFDFFPQLFSPLDDPKTFQRQGEEALAGGQIASAQAAFKVALAFDARQSAAQVGLAVSELRLGNLSNAKALMTPINNLSLRSKWFSAVAQYALEKGKKEEAESALETSLKLDSSNILARQMQFNLSKSKGKRRAREKRAQLLALNKPPVSVIEQPGKTFLVWEPENGQYSRGGKITEGWALFSNGAIYQSVAVPTGKIHFHVTAKGTKAQRVGPMLGLSWQGRSILNIEVSNPTWTDYEVETEARPGEFLLGIHFTNDLKDEFSGEDRNLKVDKVTISWSPE